MANPCVFDSKKISVCVMVHGDSATFLRWATRAATNELKKVLTDAYKVKCEVLGDGDGEVSEIRFLNIIIRCTDSGPLIEADPLHVEMVIEELDLVGG